MGIPGFWDHEERLAALSKLGNPLERIKQVVDFEAFRELLAPLRPAPQPQAPGRRPYDPVFMFKVLLLQSLNNLSDAQTEFMIRDRLTFLDFLDLTSGDPVPDEKTIWAFRNDLAQAQLIQPLFACFEEQLARAGFTPKKGTLVDGTIIPARRPHHTRKEQAQLKAGQLPPSLSANPARLAQTDLDARFTKKHDETYFGYKNHTLVDAQHKLIWNYSVSDAARHDSQEIFGLTDGLRRCNSNADFYGDSAYRSQAISAGLEQRGYRDRIHRKGYRGRPLTAHAKKANREKSRVRARVEHVYGSQSQNPGGILLRCVGMVRAMAALGLRNLGYNIKRLEYLLRRKRECPAPC